MSTNDFQQEDSNYIIKDFDKIDKKVVELLNSKDEENIKLGIELFKKL